MKFIRVLALTAVALAACALRAGEGVGFDPEVEARLTP